MNKIFLAILVIFFGSFTAYTIHMQSRDRSNAPTWAEVERAFSGKGTYVGKQDNSNNKHQ